MRDFLLLGSLVVSMFLNGFFLARATDSGGVSASPAVVMTAIADDLQLESYRRKQLDALAGFAHVRKQRRADDTKAIEDELLKALTADPVDLVAVEDSLEQLNAADARYRVRVAEALVGFAEQLTPHQRARFAEHMTAIGVFEGLPELAPPYALERLSGDTQEQGHTGEFQDADD